ncbi:hypothetical protein BY458DRAFT_497796 [Sporodiniella umbellata]|nr:hypothetical protein BY458DRAFT_497796 [Sporodiniella umbellata]
MSVPKGTQPLSSSDSSKKTASNKLAGMVQERWLTKEYKAQCNVPSKTLETKDAPRQLLVLEMHRSLFAKSGKKSFSGRPYCDRFQKYVQSHFDLVLWSNCSEAILEGACALFPTAKLVWNQSHERDCKARWSNRRLCKDLRLVWERLPGYGPGNTLFLTHTLDTATGQPYNRLDLPVYSDKHSATTGDTSLLQLIDYLDRVRHQSNIPHFLRSHPFLPALAPSSAPSAPRLLYNERGHCLSRPKQQEARWLAHVNALEHPARQAERPAPHRPSPRRSSPRRPSPRRRSPRGRSGRRRSASPAPTPVVQRTYASPQEPGSPEPVGREEIETLVNRFLASMAQELAAYDATRPY